MNKKKGFICNKSGIKIHETKNTENNNINNIQNNLLTRKSKLKEEINLNNKIYTLDLDINNYNLVDLLILFNIDYKDFNYISLKNAKNILYKIHPDKSQLDPKYFIFFSKAYNLLEELYSFLNKSNNKKLNYDDYYDENNKILLDDFLEKTNNKDPKNFNKWFNENFEKNNFNNNLQKGYGNWLNSDDDIYNINNKNVSKSNLNEIFESQKNKITSLIEYKGIEENYLSSLGGSLLDNNINNYGNSNLFNNDGLNYSDLKQAHQETLIPVNNEIFENSLKFKNINEYKNYRERQDLNPMDEKKSLNYFNEKNNNENKKSIELAYKLAKETEMMKKKNEEFWGNIKRITY